VRQLETADRVAKLLRRPASRGCRVVQLVRNTRGQRAQRRHLLRLAQRQLPVEEGHLERPELPAVGHEGQEDGERDERDRRDVERKEARHQPERQVVVDCQARLQRGGRHHLRRVGDEPPDRRSGATEEQRHQHRDERPENHRAAGDEAAEGELEAERQRQDQELLDVSEQFETPQAQENQEVDGRENRVRKRNRRRPALAVGEVQRRPEQ